MSRAHRIPLYLGAECAVDWLVEEVDEHEKPIEILAACAGVRIAVGAYEAAIASRPGKRIMLRERARVVRRSWETGR